MAKWQTQKRSLESLYGAHCSLACPTVRQDNKGMGCEATNKKATSRNDVISLCKTQSKHNSLSRLIWEAGQPAKKKMQGFVCFFFHAELLKSLPYISVAGPWRKHNTGSLFIPLDVSVLILKVNAHSGQRELNPCCHVTMKSKLWGIVQVTL